MATLYFGFVLDLHRHDTVPNDRLEADHRGVLVQGVHEETWRSRAWGHGVNQRRSACLRPGMELEPLVCRLSTPWRSLPLRGLPRGLGLAAPQL